MAIVYDPRKMLNKLAPPAKIERLVRGNLTMKKTALNFIDAADFIDKKAVSRVALNTINSYQERVAKAQVDAGLEKSAGKEITAEIVDDPKLLIQRVQNEIVWQMSKEISSTYSGEKYEWLPSDAEEPDPEHQLKYGEIYTVGDGEMPGDRYGCRCGMRILVNETELKLG